jgi:hypothetical protein
VVLVFDCGRGFGWDLAGGVIAGLIAAGIAWGIGFALRVRRNRSRFGRLAGTYRVFEKQPSRKGAGTVEVTGNGPTLDFAWTLADGSKAAGQIAMNEQSGVTGSGSYEHTRGANQGWGYLSVQVASRERGAARLLVDGTYTRQKTRDEVATAWVWEM